jgi:hypothetical protein
MNIGVFLDRMAGWDLRLLYLGDSGLCIGRDLNDVIYEQGKYVTITLPFTPSVTLSPAK